MKVYSYLLVTLAIMMAGFSSCKKGDAGPPGSANVMYSPWFTPPAYKKDTLFGIYGFSYDRPAPEITQHALDSGTVIVFGKLLGYNPAVWPASNVGQLPITVTYIQSGATQQDTWSARLSPGNLRIRFINDHNIYNNIAVQHQFRYIVIPGGQSTGRQRQLTYEEICERYNIPE